MIWPRAQGLESRAQGLLRSRWWSCYSTWSQQNCLAQLVDDNSRTVIQDALPLDQHAEVRKHAELLQRERVFVRARVGFLGFRVCDFSTGMHFFLRHTTLEIPMAFYKEMSAAIGVGGIKAP